MCSQWTVCKHYFYHKLTTYSTTHSSGLLNATISNTICALSFTPHFSISSHSHPPAYLSHQQPSIPSYSHLQTAILQVSVLPSTPILRRSTSSFDSVTVPCVSVLEFYFQHTLRTCFPPAVCSSELSGAPRHNICVSTARHDPRFPVQIGASFT